MTFTPKPSQAHDLAVLRENNYTGLLNIQTGYGKTILSCMVAKDAGVETVLVIAPMSTHKSAWYEDVELVVPGASVRVIGNGSKAEKEAMFDLEMGYPGWYVMTPQLFSRKTTDVSNWSVDLLIVDEMHQLGKPGSVGQKKLSGWPGEPEPLAARAKHVLGLSATPARNMFEYMWSAMRLLWPHLDDTGEIADFNPWSWKADRMTKATITTNQIDKKTGKKKKATKWLREKVPGRLLNEAPCVIQHFKRERCCEFHPNGFLDTAEPQIIIRDVVLSREQKKILSDLEEQSLAWLGEHPMIVDMPMTMHQRLRQVALGVPKIEFVPVTDETKDLPPKAVVTYDPDCKSPVVDVVLEEMAKLEDEAVILYVESQKFAEVMTHRLNKAGIKAAEYSGRRKAELKEFGTKYQVIVGVLAALGTGTDGLQHVSNTEIWIQRSLDSTINEQAEGRADRSGQKRQVQRIFIQDDLGMFEGQLSDAIKKRLELNRSLRKAA